jgi:hypothetical protein
MLKALQLPLNNTKSSTMAHIIVTDGGRIEKDKKRSQGVDPPFAGKRSSNSNGCV